MDDRDRAYFGRGNENEDKIGFLGDNTRAIFGRSYAAEPDVLIAELAKDDAIAEADTLLLTVPNQLGVDYNAHVIETIPTQSPPPSVGDDDHNDPLRGECCPNDQKYFGSALWRQWSGGEKSAYPMTQIRGGRIKSRAEFRPIQSSKYPAHHVRAFSAAASLCQGVKP